MVKRNARKTRSTAPDADGAPAPSEEFKELLHPGTRVLVPAKLTSVKLRSRSGTIVRRVDEDTYLVRLDEPTMALTAAGLEKPVSEVLVEWDNLTLLDEKKRLSA